MNLSARGARRVLAGVDDERPVGGDAPLAAEDASS